MNTISVIIPCYKDSKTLSRAIQSVLTQSMVVHEIIVVNDCSPETIEIENILINFPQVIYIKNINNVGLAASRNVGVRASKSTIITFLDADDELHYQKIELQYKFISQNNVVACEAQILNSNDRIENNFVLSPSVKVISNSLDNIWKNNIVGASIMISKKLLMQIGIYDETLKSCEDFDLWLRLLDSKIKVTIIKSKLYKYYYNRDGLSKNNFNISFWEIQVLNKFFIFHSDFSQFKKNLIYSFWILKQIRRFSVLKDKKMFKFIKFNINTYISNSFIRFFLNTLIYPLKNV